METFAVMIIERQEEHAFIIDIYIVSEESLLICVV